MNVNVSRRDTRVSIFLLYQTMYASCFACRFFFAATTHSAHPIKILISG